MSWLSWASLAISLLAMVFAGVSASEAHKADRDRNNISLWSLNRFDREQTITLRNLSTQRYRKVVVTLYANDDLMSEKIVDGTEEYLQILTFRNVKPRGIIHIDFMRLGMPKADMKLDRTSIIIAATSFWGTLSQTSFEVNLVNMY